MQLDITIPGTPVPQGSKRAFAGRIVDGNARTLKPWRATITSIAAQALQHAPDWDPAAPMAVHLDFMFPRPAGHYGKRGLRPSAPGWKTSRPDADKLARAVLDALTDAGIWRDDSQVVTLTAAKTWAEAPMLHAAITALH